MCLLRLLPFLILYNINFMICTIISETLDNIWKCRYRGPANRKDNPLSQFCIITHEALFHCCVERFKMKRGMAYCCFMYSLTLHSAGLLAMDYSSSPKWLSAVVKYLRSMYFIMTLSYTSLSVPSFLLSPRHCRLDNLLKH